MRSFAVLFAVLAVCCVTIQAQAEDPVEKINAYLTEQVASNEVEANFAAAKKYLAELKEKTDNSGSESVHILEDFLSLEDILDKCTVEGLHLFQKCLDGSLQKGRVSEVIKAGRAEFVTNCFDTLEDKVYDVIDTLTKEDRDRVEKFTEIARSYIKRDRPGTSYPELLRDNIKSTRNLFYNYKVFDLLIIEQKKHPERNGPVTVDSLELMSQNYIINPCERYVSKLQPQLSLWTEVMKFLNESELILDLYNYHICDHIIHEGKSDLYEDMKMIWNREFNN